MRIKRAVLMLVLSIVAVPMLAIVGTVPVAAQSGPPSYAPDQLDQMVSRIALYPDPLLAQILAAATYPDQIPDAARWADQHHYLTGQALADAIQADQLPWDPSVQALLPFPSVLDMMASDMNWTTRSGKCVPGAAAGRDGRGPEGAAAGERFRIPAKQWPDYRWRRALHHDHARESWVLSWCHITIRESCSSRRDRASWWAGRFASASA